MAKSTWVIAGTIFALLAIAAVLALIFVKTPSTQSIVPLSSNLGNCLGGQTTFSISRIDVVGSGSTFRIYGKAGGGSECLQIALTPDQLNDYLNGYTATKPLYGSVKLLKYTKTFPIAATGQDYPSILDNTVLSGSLTTGTLDGESGMLAACLQRYPDTIYAYKPGRLIYDVRCVRAGSNGRIGKVASASYGDFDMLFQLGDQAAHLSRSQIANSISAGSIDLGKNARIEWTGNLNNLDEIYSPNYASRLVNSKWTLVDSDAYAQVQNKLTEFKSCLDNERDGITSDGTFDSCRSKAESAISGILSDKTSQYEQSISNIAYDVNADSNALYVSLKAPPFPTFIIDVDASWIGVVSLSGKPEITQCISNFKGSSGSSPVFNFKVKNDAGAGATFYGDIKCGAGVQGYITQTQFAPNEEKTLTAQLITSNPNQDDLQTTCAVTMHDLKSTNTDTCNFQATVTYDSGITCKSNSYVCDDNQKNVLKCSDDGKQKTLYQACDYGCEYQDGSAKCKGAPAIESSGCKPWISMGSKTILPNIPCEIDAYLKNFKVIVAIIVGLLSFLLALTLVYTALTALQVEKTALWIITIIASIVFGAALGLLTYMYFWLGVAIAVIALIVRLLL